MNAQLVVGIALLAMLVFCFGWFMGHECGYAKGWDKCWDDSFSNRPGRDPRTGKFVARKKGVNHVSRK